MAEGRAGFPAWLVVASIAVAGACGGHVIDPEETSPAEKTTATTSGSASGSTGGASAAGGAGGAFGGAGGAMSTATGTQATGGGTGGGPLLCAGKACAPGEDCCLATGSCYDSKGAPELCQAPEGPPNAQGQSPCASSAHCADSEFCSAANPQICLGSGYCVSKSNCGTSEGSSFCGCNGVTYPSAQAACAEGVRVIGRGACGEPQVVGAGASSPGKEVTYCATSDMCPSGQACCSITGQCYDPAKPDLCAFPPEGTHYACIDDSDCFSSEYEYCYAPGCEGPGGCVDRPGDCDGKLEPVCGCNGKTYVNAGCAAVDGTRVAHEGECGG